ncbi:MAG: pirin family protein [Verrucomicrobia bacterium]|nr:MAG: pirin family protein [Verrucomicrobiota bacterium]TAE87479.1 MAG: pirin family protein [Verrucomicrobiota bacterium]TAF25761.1 MAG: pirin family protein [Verrucomicrobiota bacterium]TAF41549.1 MAG: pirin family protein [Verrucomicrobiota bacterium]
MQNDTDLRFRRSHERGRAHHGWLDSRFSFSFADYYDPSHMGFRSLRVINDDHIAPRGGFPTHPHRDMEIFSYVLEGQLAHQDSMGNARVLTPGQIQLMSAGSGITHSEFNPSGDQTTHMLQIWITPRHRGLQPRYTEWTPTPEQEREPKVLVISHDGRNHSATIAQNADIYRIKLQAGESSSHFLAPGRGLWLHLIRGNAILNGESMSPGDAASSEQGGEFTLRAEDEDIEALLFDLGA